MLRWVVVTPGMHRVHHSAVLAETNGNFGFNLRWWDMLLGTYRAQPKAGHRRSHGRQRAGGAGLHWARPVLASDCPLDSLPRSARIVRERPRQHRTKLHSTTPIERPNKEVKRRADVVGTFPNEASIMRLSGAVLFAHND